MAGGAVVVDAHAAVLRVVAAIVAAKASWIVVVSKVVRVRTPRDFHEGEHILAIDCAESLRGPFDLRLLLLPHVRMLSAIKVFEARSDLRLSIALRCVVSLDERKALFVHEGQRRIYLALIHRLVQRFFRSIE